MSLCRFRRQYEQLSQFERALRQRMVSWRLDLQVGCSNCVPTASSAAIQAKVVPLLGAPVSSRTLRRRLAEGRLESWHPLRVLPLTPSYGLRLEWCRSRGNWTAAEWNQVVFSDARARIQIQSQQ
ncbi:transposable element Tcb2 transposase [Trichonephila clavipes]|nr:transposable element Tcb2 transposase [Trichonephila clavipes]